MTARPREKSPCDGDFDENNLIACVPPLGDELLPLAGEGGGALRRFGAAGDVLDTASPFWPKTQVIFMPDFALWQQHPEARCVIFDGCELRACASAAAGAAWRWPVPTPWTSAAAGRGPRGATEADRRSMIFE